MKSNVKLHVTPEILLGLYEWTGGKKEEAAACKSFFESAKFTFEGQKIYATIKESKKATIFHIYENEEELAAARLTRIKARYGLKTYIEYAPGIVDEFQKRHINEAFRLIASTYLMVIFAYACKDTKEFPFVFVEGQDSHGDTVILIKYFRKEGEGQVHSGTCHVPAKEPFSVRGHYRKLKSGKIVWVRAHEKGHHSIGKI